MKPCQHPQQQSHSDLRADRLDKRQRKFERGAYIDGHPVLHPHKQGLPLMGTLASFCIMKRFVSNGNNLLQFMVFCISKLSIGQKYTVLFSHSHALLIDTMYTNVFSRHRSFQQ